MMILQTTSSNALHRGERYYPDDDDDDDGGGDAVGFIVEADDDVA